jgi:signal transduction histidine kinase
MIQKLLLIFCVFSFTATAAQQDAATFNLLEYTTETGLPSNLIRGIQWDENTGFLWLMTEGGVVRLNGADFKSNNKEKISPLAPEKDLFAVKNMSGTIYLSDGSGKVFQVKKNKAVLAKQAVPGKPFINYHFISVSDSFFAAKIKMPPVFTGAFEKNVPLTDTSCLLLFKNTVYAYTLSAKLPVALPLSQKKITAIFKINNHCFFIDDHNQVFFLNTNSWIASPVNLIAKDKELLNFTTGTYQLFWQPGMLKPIIISENKAWALQYNNSLSASLITTALPTDANISCVEYAEKNKTLFIGTESKGVIIIRENLLQSKRRKNANPKNKNAYFSQVLLDNGNILTNEGDIIGNSIAPAGKLPIPGKFATRISTTSNGNLIWYNANNAELGYNCLHQFNKATGQTKAFGKIKYYTTVEETDTKNYFANNKGIGILQGDSIFYLHEYDQSKGTLSMYDFKEITPGIFAVAGCSGLLQFNTVTKKLDTIYAKANACFGSIWKYKGYIFWGSYGYGYYVYKNGIVKEMPVDKNEYLLYCHCFVQDAFGFCWISTNRGLFKVKTDEIIANFENSSKPVYYHYFGKRDGIEMTELNGGCSPCAITLTDGTISFPSMDGLLWANPVIANPILPIGDIYIDEVLIDNKEISQDSLHNSTLAATVQEIIFKLGYSAWCNKENIYIEYQLNDTLNWKQLKEDDKATIQFNNLPAGKYTLRIRKLNGFESTTYSYKQISFTINTPWYQRGWFYLLCVITLISLITLYLKFRTRQYKLRQQKLELQVSAKTKELLQQNQLLEKSDAIKTRLISIISHDIITPLKFLTVAGKNLVEKRKVMPEELQQETIQEITNTSQELQLLSTNILNWIKYQNENRRLAKETFNLHELVRQVLGLLQSLAKQKKLLIENKVNETLEIHQYYEPLKILIYNLLTNSIHFTEKGTISVAATEAENNIIISVQDEGIGMTKEQVQRILADEVVITSANVDNKKGHGLGYLIIKDLIKTMNTRLTIESKKNEGTTVSIVIPSTH